MTTTDIDVRKPARRVLSAVLGEYWAITESGYDNLIEIASRQNLITPEVIDKIERWQGVLAARKATRMDGTEGVTKRNGVAIIEVVGPIFRYADSFTQISGATAVQTLATDFTAALEDPIIRGIVFTFDSPGGMVNGINEFANMVRDGRGVKPIGAYVANQAASGAYWIASAVDPGALWLDATAAVGSIGALVGARKARNGDIVEVVSTQSPKKRLTPDTEAGMAELQKTADTLAAVFIDAVKANRGASVDTLAGGMAMGNDAVKAGLADRVGSLEALISEISNGTIGDRLGGTMTTTAPVNVEALLAENENTKKALATANEQLKKQAEETQKRLIAASESEAKAFMASLSGSTDLRFGKEELDEFGALYTEAKKASVSEHKELAAFATTQIAVLEKFATKKKPVAPAGELRAGKVPEQKEGDITLEEFNEGGAKLAAAMDKYVQEKGLTGPDSYMLALAAIGKKVGAAMKSGGGSLAVDGESDDE